VKIGIPPLPLFDRLCRIAEDHFVEMVPVLRKAKLIRFPGKPHEVLPKVFDDLARAQMEHFFMPFETVAVEDDASCVVLVDTLKNQEGVSTPRRFIDAHMAFADAGAFNDSPEKVAEIEAFKIEARKMGIPADAMIVTLGTITDYQPSDTEPGKLLIAGSCSMSFCAAKVGMIMPPEAVKVDDALTSAGLKHARCALEELMYFNTTDRFVVERTPLKQHKKPAHGKLSRSYAQPIYTLLTPREIRETMKLDDPGESSKKRGHWRRRHDRLLKSDYYKDAKGKRVVVQAHWVGPEEAEIDGHHYRVRIDL